MTPSELRPSLEPDLLYPHEAAFMAKTGLFETRLLGYGALNSDGVTAMFAGLLGGRAAVRHVAGAGADVRGLLARAGIEWREDTRLFRSAEEAERHADDLIAEGRRLFWPYPLRAGRFADRAHLVPLQIYQRLNSKERLGEIVPSEHLCARRSLSPDELGRYVFERPVFLKAGGDLATGWGYAVRHCGDERALAQAKDWFLARAGDVPSVIVEEAAELVATWCMGLAISEDRTTCFGGAEQVFSAPGRQSASMIDPANAPPAQAHRLAERIGEEARKQGFLGIAGLDIGLARDGRLLVFDPNFRINASSSQLLFHAEAARRSGLPASGSVNLVLRLPFGELARRLAPLIDALWFVPTRLLNGEKCESAEGRHLLSGFVLGEDRARAERAAQRLRTALG